MNKPDTNSYRWVVLVVAFITLVLGYAIRNCFSVFYPTIVEEFGWQRGDTALIFSISIIVYGLASPVAGGLVDRFSPRMILPIGAVILGGGMALCSQATTQWEFYTRCFSVRVWVLPLRCSSQPYRISLWEDISVRSRARLYSEFR